MADDTDRYWMHPTGSTKDSQSTVPAKATSQDQAGLNRSAWINQRARRVLSSYRKDDFADPDGYLVTLVEVLERYEDKVIEAVTSAATGIQRTCKFPPSIAEFVEFIDEHLRRSNFANQYNARSQQQLHERDQIEAEEKTEPLKHRTAVANRIKAKLQAKGFQFGRDTKPTQNTWKQFSTEDLLKMYGAKK